MELYEHQKKALERLKDGNILMGGVGTGKSQVALHYYQRSGTPRDLYIITTARKRDSADWDVEAAAAGIDARPVDGHSPKLVVDSWNNIKKYVETSGAFFIFDEQRLVGSGAWVKAFLRIAKQNRWILLSGTPGDVWTDYIPVFVANGFYRNRTDFKHKHLVYSYYGGYPKLERVLGERHLERLRKQIIVDMAFERKTKRHLEQVRVGYNRDLFKEVVRTRQDPGTGTPYQDISGLVAGLRRITNTDPSRLDAVRKIYGARRRVIVFYNYDYEREELLKLWEDVERRRTDGVSATLAQWNGHKHEEVPETDSWVYLVQYMAGAEAWNCITTDTIVFYSLTYSYKLFEQAQGRIDRLNTPFEDLYYHVLVSESPMDKAAMKALEQKEDFNEKTWAQSLKKEAKQD